MPTASIVEHAVLPEATPDDADRVPPATSSDASPADTDAPDGQPSAQDAASLRLALAAAEVARDNRATEVQVLDMRSLTPVFDYFVLATGTSRRQLHAISEDIDHRLEDDLGDKRMGIEGYAESRWILLDYGSIVVHLFDQETREFYDLENLWVDAAPVALPWDDADAAAGPSGAEG